MKRILKFLIALALVTITLAGCADSSDRSNSESAGESADSADFGDAGGDDGDGADGDGAMADDAAMEEGEGDGDGEQSQNDTAGLAPADASFTDPELTAAQTSGELEIGPETVDPRAKIIFESDVTLESGNIAEAVNDVSRLAVRRGGFVASQDVSLGETGQASMTIRVPSIEFDEALTGLSAIATPLAVVTSTEDVSLQYVDIVARIATQEASLARVTELLASATDTQAILNLEAEIAQRQGEVDSLKGRKNLLDDRVDLSTIRVSIVEPGEAPVEELAAPEGEAGFADGLDRGVDAFTAVSRVLMISLGAALPFLPFVLAGGALWTWARRRRDTQRPAKGQAPMPPSPGPSATNGAASTNGASDREAAPSAGSR